MPAVVEKNSDGSALHPAPINNATSNPTNILISAAIFLQPLSAAKQIHRPALQGVRGFVSEFASIPIQAGSRLRPDSAQPNFPRPRMPG